MVGEGVIRRFAGRFSSTPPGPQELLDTHNSSLYLAKQTFQRRCSSVLISDATLSEEPFIFDSHLKTCHGITSAFSGKTPAPEHSADLLFMLEHYLWNIHI